MASNNGYDGSTTPTVSHFTKEQRTRLEALTFARKLTNGNEFGRRPSLAEWLEIADYIVLGEPR